MKKQGRPFMPPEERRKSINIKVAPATAAWLRAQNCSQGVLVDRAVELLSIAVESGYSLSDDDE